MDHHVTETPATRRSRSDDDDDDDDPKNVPYTGSLPRPGAGPVRLFVYGVFLIKFIAFPPALGPLFV